VTVPPPVLIGVGNLQLTHDTPVPVEIQPVPMIFILDLDVFPVRFLMIFDLGCFWKWNETGKTSLGGRDGQRAIRPRAAARAGAPAGATARAGSPQASADASARHQGEEGGGRRWGAVRPCHDGGVPKNRRDHFLFRCTEYRSLLNGSPTEQGGFSPSVASVAAATRPDGRPQGPALLLVLASATRLLHSLHGRQCLDERLVISSVRAFCIGQPSALLISDPSGQVDPARAASLSNTHMPGTSPLTAYTSVLMDARYKGSVVARGPRLCGAWAGV
jgi:hypothetical protein